MRVVVDATGLVTHTGQGFCGDDFEVTSSRLAVTKLAQVGPLSANNDNNS